MGLYNEYAVKFLDNFNHGNKVVSKWVMSRQVKNLMKWLDIAIH